MKNGEFNRFRWPQSKISFILRISYPAVGNSERGVDSLYKIFAPGPELTVPLETS